MSDGTEEVAGAVLSGCLWRATTLLAFVVGGVMVATGDGTGWGLIAYSAFVLGWEAWRWARRDP